MALGALIGAYQKARALSAEERKALPIMLRGGALRFLLTRLHDWIFRADGALGARLTGPQGSGILTSMARANALLVVPEDRPRSEPGERLNALPLSDDAELSESFFL